MSYVHNFASFNYGDPLCGDHLMLVLYLANFLII